MVGAQTSRTEGLKKETRDENRAYEREREREREKERRRKRVRDTHTYTGGNCHARLVAE